MRISNPDARLLCNEVDIYSHLLPFEGACVLELGCGRAEKTVCIAQNERVKSIVALEVDLIQHAENVRSKAPDNVSFQLGGAQAIPAADASFDIVLMFKSLHHVPVALMDTAMEEIHRVLKPGGVAYISEPVFAGDFNEVLRLFHDEQQVREAAFSAVKRSVASGRLESVSQTFFSTPIHFSSFAEFEENVIRVTHTEHRLSPDLYQQVQEQFMRYANHEGVAFQMPVRVDLLRKSAIASQ